MTGGGNVKACKYPNPVELTVLFVSGEYLRTLSANSLYAQCALINSNTLRTVTSFAISISQHMCGKILCPRETKSAIFFLHFLDPRKTVSKMYVLHFCVPMYICKIMFCIFCILDH